jgi:hypothetical protein
MLPRIVLAVAVLLAAVSTCRAQEGPFNEAGPLGLPLAARHLVSYCTILGFDADQTAAAAELHRGYRAAFREATKRVQTQAKELPPEKNSRQTRMGMAATYVDEIQALERQFLGDLRMLCNEEQAARFASVERARRRDVGARLAFAGGDGIDLVVLIRESKIRPTPEVDNALLRWEEEIDRIEIERERLTKSIFRTVTSSKDGEPPMDDIQSFLRDLHAVSIRSRDATKRAFRELSPSLNEQDRHRLAAEIQKRSFPRIYADSDAERAITSVLGFQDLSAEQRAQVQEIESAYRREAGPINDRWAAATEEKQAELARNLEAARIRDGEKDAYHEVRAERLALDGATLQKLSKVLTDEQRARVPKPSRRNHGGPEYLPALGEGTADKEWEEFQAEG